jgi:hypothetical protein
VFDQAIAEFDLAHPENERDRDLTRTRSTTSPPTTTTPERPRNAFTGGTISRIAVDVSCEPYLDLERQAVAMLVRE